MNIQTDQGTRYRVAFDKSQWIVSAQGDPRRGPKWADTDPAAQAAALAAYEKGEGSYKDLSYHNRLRDALSWLADRLAGEQTAADLAELRAFVEDAHKRIEAAAALVTSKS